MESNFERKIFTIPFSMTKYWTNNLQSAILENPNKIIDSLATMISSSGKMRSEEIFLRYIRYPIDLFTAEMSTLL
jgi:hypothetical protein